MGLESSGTLCVWNGSVLEGQLNLDSAQLGGDLRCDKSKFVFPAYGSDSI